MDIVQGSEGRQGRPDHGHPGTLPGRGRNPDRQQAGHACDLLEYTLSGNTLHLDYKVAERKAILTKVG